MKVFLCFLTCVHSFVEDILWWARLPKFSDVEASFILYLTQNTYHIKEYGYLPYPQGWKVVPQGHLLFGAPSLNVNCLDPQQTPQHKTFACVSEVNSKFQMSCDSHGICKCHLPSFSMYSFSLFFTIFLWQLAKC